MYIRNRTLGIGRKGCLAAALLASAATMTMLSTAGFAQDDTMEVVTVTGYRASLTSATNAKKDSVSFSESIFSEDIGKFPDTNIAESFNRIPGVHINRDVDGEGVAISIRGLGSSFTKVLLNGAPVAIASSGAKGSQNQNREVDLNMFPTELFSQLSVEKTPRADQEEGGIAGVVNMRSARPFDHPGPQLTYNLQGSYNQNGGSYSPHGTLVASDTWGKWGLLVGVSTVSNNFKTTGYETVGYTTTSLSTAQCATGETCNTIGGKGISLPSTVPTTAAGLTAGETINAAWIQSHNPDVTTAEYSNALIPRIGRTMQEEGNRTRFNAVTSLEYRPNDNLQFYADVQYGRVINAYDANYLGLCGRNCKLITENMETDTNGVVTSATFTNAQYMLEAAEYHEKQDFIGLNPGMSWQITDKLHFDFNANYTRSHFFRDLPDFMFVTNPSAGLTVNYTNTGGIPTFTNNISLNNASLWQWSNNSSAAEGSASGFQIGRAYIQQEKRYTATKGLHGSFTYGGDEFSVKVGGDYDDTLRSIEALEATNYYQQSVCGGNSSSWAASPNTQPSCTGLDNVSTYSSYYPSYYTQSSLQGSSVTASSVSDYIDFHGNSAPTINIKKLKAATNYSYYEKQASFVTSSSTGASSGSVQEKTKGFFLEVNGNAYINDHSLRYNAGIRWIETDQAISGPVTITNAENSSLSDGSYLPNTYYMAMTNTAYQAILPSVNASYEVFDSLIVRVAASRSMTRPNPSSMLPGLTFSDPSAADASIGNPNLKPYFSDNFDIGAEYYTGGEGYIGAMVFEKQMEGFTVTGSSTKPITYLEQYGITYDLLTTTQQSAITNRGGWNDNTMITVSQQVNAQGLMTIKGLELTWVQPLDFLLEPYGLKGFGYSANITFLDQKSTGAAPAVATDIPPYAYNVTGYYESDGFMVRLSYAFTAGSAQSSNNQNSVTAARIYSDDYGQMDLSASYKLSKLVGREIMSDPEFTFSAQNVLGEKQRSYFEYESAPYSIYKSGTIIMFGIHGTF